MRSRRGASRELFGRIAQQVGLANNVDLGEKEKKENTRK